MPAALGESGSFLVIIAIVCLTIGYVFGWLISSILHGREEKKEQEKAVEENLAAAAALPENNQQPIPVISGNKGVIFALRQGDSAESLVVEFDGKMVRDPASLSLDDRTQIESALHQTATWMGLTYQLGEPAPAVAISVPVQAATISAAGVEAMDAPGPASVIAGVTTALADVLQPTVKKEAPLSIVQQIDVILQEMLPGTPYENQKIYLVEDPKKGVIVRVGTDVYEGVNAVPEGEIKKLLRAAVAEWERRQEMSRRRQTV
jgi:hypothetical protein